MPTLFLHSAKGGQGCSTTASILAVLSSKLTPTVLVAHADDDPYLVIGVRVPSTRTPITSLTVRDSYRSDLPDNVTQIVDVGITEDFWNESGRHVMVVRNCYLALRRTLKALEGRNADLALVLSEPERALTTRDVESVLGVPVTEVPFLPALARMVDAGLIGTGRLPPFRDLDRQVFGVSS